MKPVNYFGAGIVLAASISNLSYVLLGYVQMPGALTHGLQLVFLSLYVIGLLCLFFPLRQKS